MTSAPVPFVIVTVCDLPCVATRCFPYASEVFEIVSVVRHRSLRRGRHEHGERRDQRDSDAERGGTSNESAAAEQIDSPESDTRRFMPLATVTGIDLPRDGT